jgi:sugar phosphate isomerase/epimerase
MPVIRDLILRKKGAFPMQVGILTAPFQGESLDTVLQFARENGFDALEINATPGSSHLDPSTATAGQLAEIKSQAADSGVVISSLAAYMNTTAADPNERASVTTHLKKTIDAAQALGLGVVCCMAGMPVPGKSRMKTIEEDCAEVFPPLLDHAKSAGIKLAMENWTATNIMHLGHWERIFQVLPQENFGLNYDPSHLYWQGIDYMAAVDRFKDRIFHTHAKDTEVDEHRLRWYGNQEGGWWRYVIPGFGKIEWGEYIARLRRSGYNGVLSIEHEDDAVGREEGFLIGKNYLRNWIA